MDSPLIEANYKLVMLPTMIDIHMIYLTTHLWKVQSHGSWGLRLYRPFLAEKYASRAIWKHSWPLLLSTIRRNIISMNLAGRRPENNTTWSVSENTSRLGNMRPEKRIHATGQTDVQIDVSHFFGSMQTFVQFCGLLPEYRCTELASNILNLLFCYLYKLGCFLYPIGRPENVSEATQDQ